MNDIETIFTMWTPLVPETSNIHLKNYEAGLRIIFLV